MNPQTTHEFLGAAEIADGLHVAFGTMLPFNEIIESGGSRSFFSKRVTAEVLGRIRDLRAVLGRCKVNGELSKLWFESGSLVLRISMLGRNATDHQINRAMELLYAASALTYQNLAESSEEVAIRKRGGYIEEDRVILSKKCRIPALTEGTMLDAIVLLSRMQNGLLPVDGTLMLFNLARNLANCLKRMIGKLLRRH